MKYLIIFLLTVYKSIVSPLKNQLLGQTAMCRFPQTCSEYTKEAIMQYGILRGGVMGFKRFLSCSPLTKNIYANL